MPKGPLFPPSYFVRDLDTTFSNQTGTDTGRVSATGKLYGGGELSLQTIRFDPTGKRWSLLPTLDAHAWRYGDICCSHLSGGSAECRRPITELSNGGRGQHISGLSLGRFVTMPFL